MSSCNHVRSAKNHNRPKGQPSDTHADDDGGDGAVDADHDAGDDADADDDGGWFLFAFAPHDGRDPYSTF